MPKNFLYLSVIVIILQEVATRCDEKYRLSNTVKPTFYSIKIYPNLEEEVFAGEVFIHLKVQVPVEAIELHSSNLEIEKIFFDNRQVEERCSCKKQEYGYEFADFELLRIVRKRLIAPGAHVLHIKYKGKFSDNKGLFKAACTINNVVVNHLYATDFEPTSSRQVFPNFDEPSFKAKFELTLLVPNNSYTALSNMRVKQIFEVENGNLFKFETSPLMSSYLLSFAIIQSKYSEYLNEEGVPFRIYSFDASNNTELLEFSDEVSKFYSNFTRFKFSIPKIDFLGYDRYLNSATENWGLVTFNTSLLSEDDYYNVAQKKAVIAHELAHFWFGNLVTNDWWDDIWLQESFATFMSLKAEEFLLRNDIIKQFPLMYMEKLFWTESTKSTTPVINFQEVPEEIVKNFNEITYIKGAAILKMIEAILGDENFRSAIIKYIETYAFKTATTEDFLSVLSDLSDEPNLRDFIHTFLYQSGFPLVQIEETEDSYVLTQRNATFQEQISSFDYKWTIPITYITDLDNSSHLVWFDKDMDKLIIPKNNATWIKLNYQQLGYYRVNYSESIWEALMSHNQEIESYERTHLLLEALGVFNLNLTSCDLVMKYLLKVSESPKLSPNFAYTIYLTLDSKIKFIDSVASHHLKNYFGRVLLNMKKIKSAKMYLRNFTHSVSETRDEIFGMMKSCVDWLRAQPLIEFPEEPANNTIVEDPAVSNDTLVEYGDVSNSTTEYPEEEWNTTVVDEMANNTVIEEVIQV